MQVVKPDIKTICWFTGNIHACAQNTRTRPKISVQCVTKNFNKLIYDYI